MSWSKPQTFKRPHQKRERPETHGRGGFRPYRRVREEMTAHPDDSEYWSWRPLKIKEPDWGDHSAEWRARQHGVLDPTEALSTLNATFGRRTGVQGSTGVRGPQGPDPGEEDAEATRKEVRECKARSDTNFLKGVEATRTVRPTSPPLLEVRCMACGAGSVTSASGKTVESGIGEALDLLRTHWDGKTCEEVRETLTVLTVLES